MEENAVMPAMPEREPEAHISWPGPEEVGKDKSKAVKVTGDLASMARGRRVRVTIEGVVSGVADHRYGGSLDLRTKSITLESLGDGPDAEMGRPMTEVVE